MGVKRNKYENFGGASPDMYYYSMAENEIRRWQTLWWTFVRSQTLKNRRWMKQS